jgi:chorismate synthase
MNSFGRIFRVEIFGESHGPAVGAIVDGCPPGLALSAADFEADLGRRRAGGPGTTPRRESDLPEFLSGLYGGRTTGGPLTVVFRNENTRGSDYEGFAALPRPGHADFSGRVRYRGFADPRGGGHFSGRLTLGLVAAGVVAKRVLKGATFATRFLRADGSPYAEGELASEAAAAAAEADSIGAIVETRVKGLPAGLGEPFFDSVEGTISQAVFAVPGVRGVEFGDGFRAAAMRGSEHNDPFVDASGRTAKNGSGGVNGGITNGNELVFRAAVKPTSSIGKNQKTFDFEKGAMSELLCPGRHDACIALRAAVAVEDAAAIALADFALIARTYDYFE